ncbi:OmpA family protein [Thiothrix subterranea]|nr:OmpA family protein [Thiothrix subterranea]
MTLTSDTNFDFDKAILKPAGQANLDQFLAGLAGAKVSGISVTGHTDSVGSDAYNQKLSEQRASAVANYLASKGVPAAAIQATGKGESQPVADNGTKAGRAANRRVDVVANGTR